jgi:hypothetical protein
MKVSDICLILKNKQKLILFAKIVKELTKNKTELCSICWSTNIFSCGTNLCYKCVNKSIYNYIVNRLEELNVNKNILKFSITYTRRYIRKFN